MTIINLSAMVGGKAKGGVGVLPSAVPTYSAGIAKGIREPVDPFREMFVFGSDGVGLDASGWYDVPQFMAPLGVYDMTGYPPNRGITVILFTVYNLYTGADVEFVWRRTNNTPAELFRSQYAMIDPHEWGYDYWGWYYSYAYVMYAQGQVYSNATYAVDVRWNDGSGWVNVVTKPFTVTGIVLPTVTNPLVTSIGKL